MFRQLNALFLALLLPGSLILAGCGQQAGPDAPIGGQNSNLSITQAGCASIGQVDANNDGICDSDFQELAKPGQPFAGCDPNVADCDGNGIKNGDEDKGIFANPRIKAGLWTIGIIGAWTIARQLGPSDTWNPLGLPWDKPDQKFDESFKMNVSQLGLAQIKILPNKQNTQNPWMSVRSRLNLDTSKDNYLYGSKLGKDVEYIFCSKFSVESINGSDVVIKFLDNFNPSLKLATEAKDKGYVDALCTKPEHAGAYMAYQKEAGHYEVGPINPLALGFKNVVDLDGTKGTYAKIQVTEKTPGSMYALQFVDMNDGSNTTKEYELGLTEKMKGEIAQCNGNIDCKNKTILRIKTEQTQSFDFDPILAVMMDLSI